MSTNASPPDAPAPAPDPTIVETNALERLVGGADHNPHGILGAHPAPNGQTVIRTLRPEASEVAVVLRDGTHVPMRRLHDAGVFAAAVDGPPDDYRLDVSY